ncbi:hypothetical protein AB0I95_15045 [Micromonospora sp. NPDC049751]|uniref:hypothetical protein n=1 Tax=Micromonospora sp. NPDC049751 TaxID=3154837 RepID=UPI0033D4063A
MLKHTYQPTLITEQVDGGYQVTVRFALGYFVARPPIIGATMPTIGEAMTVALHKALPVLTEIATPREYPDAD